MYNILTLNKISNTGLKLFSDEYVCSDNCENPEAVLVRSASMHEMEMPKSLLAIARAGAGVNNIPLDKCSEEGIVVFNTPGANANAVKELVIAGMLLSSRKIVDGIEWTKTLKGNGSAVGKMVEKGKSAFAGPEIMGKKIGVIGLGAIGVLVANAALSLGMEVYGYDPYISVKGAWGLSSSVQHALSLDTIFANCDYITIHVPLTNDTKEVICEANIAKMKDGVRILNFARAELVNSNDIIKAIADKKISAYVTDFATDDIIGVDGITILPHLGASTPESEDNCAKMAVQEVREYLENGNIVNSVNMPAVSMDRTGDIRVCVIHKNVPNVISQISSKISETGSNIENMQSKSRGDYAYSIFDVKGNADVTTAVSEISDVIRVRVI